MKYKKIKVFFNGERLRDIYPHASKFQVFKWKIRKFFRKVIIASFCVGVVFGAFKIGSIVAADTVYTVNQVMPKQSEYPVLDRIAKCESGNTHIDPKTGQVLVRGNTNKTVDVGRHQINETYWGKKATELGLNIYDEKDNRKMAEWIFLNVGTSPWNASMKCWNK
jgi:hypothetical protein